MKQMKKVMRMIERIPLLPWIQRIMIQMQNKWFLSFQIS